MKIISAEFSKCAVSRTEYPRDGLAEIALIGRSNVGKSSLINTFLNRRSLAKTSSAPGKTRTVNFYKVNNAFYFVDLPGFGYAKVPVSVRRGWERMVEEYFMERGNVLGALVVLDVRRDPGEVEENLFSWLAFKDIPAITVITKTDKLSGNKLASRVALLKRALPAVDPLIFSAVSRAGRTELIKKVQGLLLSEVHGGKR